MGGGHLFRLRRHRIDSDIIDVSGLSLDELAGLPAPVLERSLRRARREAVEGPAHTVSFRSVIADPNSPGRS